MDDTFRCDICDRNFGSQEAIDSHNKAKHTHVTHHKHIKKINSNTKKIIIYSSIILILIIAAFLFYKYSTSTSAGPGKYDALAQYLTEKGAVMYGTEWCPHCKAQKELFDNSFKYINYVDCDKSRSTCDAAGVEGYPTWVINGQKYAGTQSLEKLAGLTNFTGLASNPSTDSTVLNNNDISENAQTATLSVSGSSYILQPSTFKKDVPVSIVADVNSMPGCSKAVTIPSLGVMKFVKKGDNIITFTPTQIGTFKMACSMNMYTTTFNVE